MHPPFLVLLARVAEVHSFDKLLHGIHLLAGGKVRMLFDNFTFLIDQMLKGGKGVIANVVRKGHLM